MRLSVFESGSFDPYWNLALEEQKFWRESVFQKILVIGQLVHYMSDIGPPDHLPVYW